jgi:putative aldouronate transport system substrate-binding protein
VDEFYTTIKAFKENESVLGAKDVMPLGVIPVGGYHASTPIFEAFTKTPTDEEIAAVPLFLRDGFLDGLKFFNKLYQEGLMNKEFGLDTNSQKIKEQYVNNQIGFVASHSSYPWLDLNTMTLRNKAPEAEMVAFPGLKNKSNEIVMQQGVEIGFYNMVPKTSKNPEAAVKYLDWMMNEGSEKLWWGFEGEHYDMKDGKMVIKDAAYNAKTLDYMRGWLAITYNMTADRDPQKQRDTLQYRIAGKDGEIYLKGIELFEKVGKRSVVFDAVPDMQLKYGGALSKLANDTLTKLIMAPPDKVEAGYKAFVDEYMKAGGKEVMDEAKKLFQDMKKK